MTRRLLLFRLREHAVRHEALLWWIHSLYALALGVTLMWLGARHFTWLRVAAFHILAIWTCSLLLANYIDRPDHRSRWWARARLIINYVTKNFYQQILFFILPIYAASATLASRNILFVIVLGASAVLSTLDVIYDALTPGYVGRVYVVTALEAPMGLRDRVEMRWYRGTHLLWASQARSIVGGRKEGFRLWSSVPITRDQSPDAIRLDVVTEAGQLIGRALLPVLK